MVELDAMRGDQLAIFLVEGLGDDILVCVIAASVKFDA